MFLSFTLFILRVVQPVWHGIAIPVPYYVTIQSISMLLIALVMGRRPSKRETPVHAGILAANQFLFAIIIITGAYFLMTEIIDFSLVSPMQLSPLTIMPIYVLIALAELLLSPVGLSTVTVLSSRHKVSTMMGVFFVSLGVGGFLSGKLAALTAIPNGDNQTLVALKLAYSASFHRLFVILCVILGVTVVINYIIRTLCRSPHPA
ncbi:MAG: hypothetical protein B7X00_01805 [Legionella sp. 21-45-4]|nr:MAG: hypothetical protein B7X00_01805 [Legionella sp. 21-45-4]